MVSWSLNEFNKTLRNARLDSRIKKELLKDGQDDVNEMQEVLLGKRGVEVLTGKYSLGIDDRYVDTSAFWIFEMSNSVYFPQLCYYRRCLCPLQHHCPSFKHFLSSSKPR